MISLKLAHSTTVHTANTFYLSNAQLGARRGLVVEGVVPTSDISPFKMRDTAPPRYVQISIILILLVSTSRNVELGDIQKVFETSQL
jgi:hypothetical protein